MNRPNILFLIADQWAATTADGRQNDPEKPWTPHIGRLAREGTSFARSYSFFEESARVPLMLRNSAL